MAGFMEKLVIMLPGQDEPEEDLRVIAGFVLDRLQQGAFSAAGPSSMTEARMQKTVEDMGFNKTEAINLLAFLQMTGLLVRTSFKRGSQWIWYCCPHKGIAEKLPIEVLSAAWRRQMAWQTDKDEVERLQHELDKVRRQPGVNEDFLAEVDKRHAALAEERDDAVRIAKELEHRVEELEHELSDRPDTSREVILEAFIARMDSRLHASKAAERSSKSRGRSSRSRR